MLVYLYAPNKEEQKRNACRHSTPVFDRHFIRYAGAMTSMDTITLVPHDKIQLGPKVFLGTIDVAAVGARVLYALQAPDGWSVQDIPLDIHGFDFAQKNRLRPVLTAAATQMDVCDASSAESPQPPPVLLRNFYAPRQAPANTVDQATSETDGIPQISLLILNTTLSPGEQAELAVAVLQLINGSDLLSPQPTPPQSANPPATPDRSVCVVAAMLMQHVARPAALYQHLLHEAPPLDAALPPLPPSGPAADRLSLRDGQLAALMHVLAVSGTPACCLMAPGHKPPANTPLDLPDSAAACDTLGAALSAALGLVYDAAKCRSIRASYKWFVPEQSAGSDVMYL